MSKNNYQYERFVVDDPPEDLYGWKYGVDNSKTMYDTHKGQRAAALKSPYAVYLLALVAFMLFWFVYSFIHAAMNESRVAVLLRFLPSFFVLAACVTIIFLSVFGVWGKFARRALKKNMVSAKGGDRERLEAEVQAADANKGKENALNIFEDYVEVINYGERQVLRISLLRQVLIRKYGGPCSVTFVSLRGEKVYACADVPKADIYQIKAIFGNMCKVESGARRKREKETRLPDFYYEKEKFELEGAQIAGLVMGGICAAVGGAVVALHYCVNETIPMPLGIFFIAGGLLAIITVFSAVPVVKVFVIPFLFGLIFTGFPFMLSISISQSEGVKVVLPTFHEFLCSFSPLYCGLFFIAGMGLLLILVAFVNLIKYLRNRG